MYYSRILEAARLLDTLQSVGNYLWSTVRNSWLNFMRFFQLIGYFIVSTCLLWNSPCRLASCITLSCSPTRYDFHFRLHSFISHISLLSQCKYKSKTWLVLVPVPVPVFVLGYRCCEALMAFCSITLHFQLVGKCLNDDSSHLRRLGQSNRKRKLSAEARR